MALLRGTRVRTRGGRGRGLTNSRPFDTYKRSDLNTFEVLSDLPQDGDDVCTSRGIDSEGFTLVRKRQRVSTGGKSNEQLVQDSLDPDFISNFEQMNSDEKLSAIFSTLTCNQNKIMHIEQKVNHINMFNGKMARAETVMHSYNDRLKLLEYRSIDLEARSRRNNLLFKGFPESRDENCRGIVCGLLQDKLSMEELPTIERVHRLGRFNPAKGPRPIIVAFSFFIQFLRTFFRLLAH